MKITSLTVAGIRSHIETRLKALGKLVLVVGANGSGKSGLLDSIEYAFTGSCRGTDEAGRGYENLLPPAPEGKPATGGVVTVTTDRGLVNRMVGQGPKSTSQDAISRTAGASRQALKCALRSQSFLDMPSKDQEGLIRELMTGQVSEEDAVKAFGMTMDGISSFMLTTMDGVGQAYTLAYGARTALKKQLADQVKPQAAPEDMKLGEFMVSALSDEVLAANLTDFQTLLDQIKAHDEYSKKLEHLHGERKSLTDRLVVLRAKLAPLPDKPTVEADINDLRLKVSEEGKLNDKRQAAYNDCISKARQADDLAAQCAQRLNKLEAQRVRGSGNCEACGQSVDAVKLRLAVDDISRKIAEHKKTAYAANKEAEKCQPAGLLQNDSKAKLKKLEADLELIIAVRNEGRAHKGRISEIDGLLAKGAAACPGDYATTLKAIGILVAHLHHRKYLADRDTQIEGLRASVEQSEQAVKALGPGGPVRALHLGSGDGIKALLDEVTRISVTLGVGDVAVDFAPKWSVKVDGRPAELLSASERFRVSIAFATAIARQTKLNMVCLDGADILDDGNRNALLTLVESLGLDQVIISATSTMDNINEAMPEWSIVYLTLDANGSTKARQ